MNISALIGIRMRGSPGVIRTLACIAGVLCVVPSAVAEPSYTAIAIEHPAPQAFARFGRALATVGDIDGDSVSDILVGARSQNVGTGEACPGNREGGMPRWATTLGGLCSAHETYVPDAQPSNNEGKAYAFSGATGALLLTLESPQPQPGGSFGRAVAAVGDVDRDNVPDLFVGAPFEDVLGVEEQGSAFIFSGANGNLLLRLDNPTPQAFSHFGLTVAGVGDISGDGVPDAMVGAHFQDVGPNIDEGIAYVYSGSDGSLIHTINNPIPKPFAIFADQVAGVLDIDGDSVPDLIIGAPYQSIRGQWLLGRAFVFSGASGELIRVLDNPDPQTRSLFGTAVAGVADVTGDGVGDLMVGALYQDVDGNEDQGQAFVFSGASGALVHTLDTPTPQAGALLSVWAAGLGDIDGDGVPDLFSGAPEQDVGGNDRQGQAFVFSGATGQVLITLDNPDPGVESFFGFPTTRAGDVNADGITDLLVGASGQTVNGMTRQGRVYLFISNAP